MTGDSKAETAARQTISLALGGLAFAASFEHTRTVVVDNGQPGWVGLATAVGIELVAAWSVLELRHRRRHGQSTRWPVFSLLFGVGVSAACNLATRGPGTWGAVVAVMPACLFLLTLIGKITRPDTPHTDDPAPASHDVPGVPRPHTSPARHTEPNEPDRPPTMPDIPAQMLGDARAVAAELTAAGRKVSRRGMAEGMRARGHRIGSARADELVQYISAETRSGDHN